MKFANLIFAVMVFGLLAAACAGEEKKLPLPEGFSKCEALLPVNREWARTGIAEPPCDDLGGMVTWQVKVLDYEEAVSGRKIIGSDFFGFTLEKGEFYLGGPTGISISKGGSYLVSSSLGKAAIVDLSTGQKIYEGERGKRASGKDFLGCYCQELKEENCSGLGLGWIFVSIKGQRAAAYMPVCNANYEGGFFDTMGGGKVLGCGLCSQKPLPVTYGKGETAIDNLGGILYLPSYAGFSDMSLLSGLPEGAELSGSMPGARLVVGQDKLDFTKLFGEMQPGVKYTVRVAKNGFMDSLSFFWFMKSHGLPAIYLKLGNDCKLTYLHLGKARYCKGALVRVEQDGRSSGVLNVKKMAGRGNTSWVNSGEKRPYRLNLDKAYCLVKGAGEHKKFAFLSNNCGDRSGLRDALAHDMGKVLGGEFVPGYEFADLYVNGEYRGFYNVKERVTLEKGRVDVGKTKFACEDTEKVTRVVQKSGIKGALGASAGPGDPDDLATYGGKWEIPEADSLLRSEDDSKDEALAAGIQAYQYASSSKVKPGKYGGVCLEMNVQYWHYMTEGICFFVTRRGQILSFKEPECASKEQVQKAALFVQELEDALFSPYGFNAKGRHYSEYADVQSFARHFVVDGFMGNTDFCFLSFYVNAKANGNTGAIEGRLSAEPLWDYDCAPMTEKGLFFVRGFDNPAYWAPMFCNKADFMEALSGLTAKNSSFFALIKGLAEGGLAQRIENMKPAYALNETRFGSNSLSVAQRDLASLKVRAENYFALFSGDKLLGAHLEKSGKSLAVKVLGQATAFQWHAVDESGQARALEGETKETLGTNKKGRYFCGVKGGNVAFMEGQANPILSGREIWLYTAPMKLE